MHEAGVACLSGASFGAHGEGYVRLSYANSVENIEQGVGADWGRAGEHARRNSSVGKGLAPRERRQSL